MSTNLFESSFPTLVGGCRRHVPILTAGVLVLAGTLPAHAQKAVPAAPIKATAVSVPDNLNNGLQQMVQDYLASNPAGKTAKAVDSTVPSVLANYPDARADAQNRVIVDIYLDGTDTIEAVVTKLVGLGCKIESRLDWYGHGALAVWLPLDQAVATGNMKGVHYVNLALKPHHNVGKCTSQGTVVLKIEPIASMTGGLGQGITVGALSDSYDKLKTTGTGTTTAPLYPNDHAVDDVASGDLPGTGNPDGYTTPVNVLKDYTSSTGVEDEGRGMLQIVHDMVPAANLAFYTADISEVDFAAGIVALQAAGCNVICDDVGYFDEPMFSDGPVGQAIDRVTAAGATYFSSAGNDGSSGYVGTFTPVTNNATAQGYLAAQGVPYANIGLTEQLVITEFHAFGTNPDGTPILVQNIRIPGTSADATGRLEFQWDDPYLVLSSQGATNNVTTDFDILVFNAAGTIQTSRSGQTNNYTSKIPLELPGTALAAATSYKIVIVRTNRAATSATPNLATHLRYAIQTNDTPVRGDFLNPTSPETHGHAAAATCIGTAAYRYDASPVADVHDSTHTIYPIVEQFSSNGPVSIYFDSAGNRLATPVVRKQPLLSATNGVDTSFFPPVGATSGTTPPAVPSPTNPSSQDFDGDGYPNFFGTSAAAPSGAGVAAALLGVAKANNIPLTPADVRSLLTATTQGNQDQTPGSAVGTAGSVSVTAGGYGRTDNNGYTVAYTGAAGTTLTSITIDLSTIGAHFDTTTAIPTDTSTTATGTGVVVSSFNGTTTPAGTTAPSVASYTVGTGSTGTANSLLTVNFANFSPGATLKFGIGRRNDVVNIFAQLGEVLGGMTPTSPGALLSETDSAGTASGRFVNTFSKKWNYKEGYGLIDAQAAINRMLGN